MNKLVQNINDAGEALEGFDKTIQFIFDDITVGFWVKIGKAGGIEKLEKLIKNEKESEIILNFSDPETLWGIFEKDINPPSVLGSRMKITKGNLSDLMTLNAAF